MTNAPRGTGFTNRDFISAIRARLEVVGHGDLLVDRNWIDEDQPGRPFLLRVPVGSALVVPLMPLSGFYGVDDRDKFEMNAGHFADALVTLKRGTEMIERYVRDVRRAACREIAAARADGLDVLLEGVGVKPTFAYNLAGRDLQDAAYYVDAEIRLRHLDFRLRPSSLELWVAEPDDVAKELAPILRDQRAHQELLATMGDIGADLMVDGITLDLLEAHGLAADEVLREVWRRGFVNLTVQVGGWDARLSLTSNRGEATASLDLEEVCWNGHHLWFRAEAHATGNAGLVGGTLGDRVRHPVLSERPIVAVEGRQDDQIVLDLGEKSLFDADTARIWSVGRLAT